MQVRRVLVQCLKDPKYAKQVLLEKGEFLGFGVAVALMAVFLLFGLKSVFTSSASANAGSLSKINDAKRSLIASSKPQGEPDEGKPADPSTDYGKLVTPDRRVMSKVELAAVSPADWAVWETFFTPGKVPGDKRLGPAVKTPVEFRTAVALAQLDVYKLSDDRDRIWVLEGAGGTGTGADQFQKSRTQASGFYNSMQQKMQQGQQQQSGKGPASMMGGKFGGLPSGMDRPGAGPTEGAKGSPKLVKIDELEKLQGAKLMEDVFPRRIAIIAASFPYKDQLEEFRQKLRFKNIAELMGDKGSPPAFTGVDVQRAEVLPNKETPYVDVPLAKAVQQLILLSGRRFEDDAPELEPVSFDGLVMDRPKQFREGQYPKVEMDLKRIEETLAALKNAKDAQIVKPKNRFTDDDLNPYSRSKSSGQDTKGMSPTGPGADLTGAPKTGKAPDGSSSTGNQPQVVPDYCLVRVLDPTIDPGKTYRYRLRVRMANPNYKRQDVAWASLADGPEIESDWVDVPGTVTVPPEVLYYAVDMRTVALQEKKPDADLRQFLNTSPPGPGQVAVQVHRWLETIAPDTSITYTVGDWAIAERLLLYRGEYMTRKARVEVPVRDAIQDKFTLAASRRLARGEKRTVEVPFGPENGADSILVDFQGGQMEYNRYGVKDDKADYTVVRDKAPVELVVMTPDGKLHIHDGDVDLKDKERETRYRSYKDRIKEIKEDSKPATDKTSPLNPLGPSGGKPGGGN
jgi:hypothetical protein